MLSFIIWYLTITLLGWVTFPVAFRLLPALSDRGYTLARALGWLLWGYLFWLLASLQVLQNDLGGQLLAFGLVLAISIWASLGGWFRELRTWVRGNRSLILIAEILFLLAFGFWTLIRAMDPGIAGTEKPMDMAFISSIMRSPEFPPQDPWMSGYGISYYYFGHLLVSMLTRITGVVPEIGFNLALGLLFGMTAIGAYGLVYNLLKARRGTQSHRQTILSLPLLGPLFILLVSNLEGLLEMLHARGLFWEQTSEGLKSGFWSWLGVLDLNAPPAQPFSWEPNRMGGNLWWRASRILSDYQLDGSFREVIDEFPFFSYLLGDLHPHVLAMPFALLVIGIGLHFFLDRRRPGFSFFGLWVPMDRPILLLSMLALGSLGFLNTWDFPIYVLLFAGTYALIRYREEGWSVQRLGDFLGLAFVLGIGGILLYLPFYIGFASQARGFLPSLIFFTRGVHFWIMFAPLLLPVIAFLVYLVKRSKGSFSWHRGLLNAALVVGGLWALSYLMGFFISLLPAASGLFLSNQAGSLPADIFTVIQAATLKRFQAPGAWLSLLGILFLLFGLLTRPRPSATAEEVEAPPPAVAVYANRSLHPSDGFTLLLVLLGALLVVGPEFFYLWDLFGTRMNTIFKFYYQAWLVWGIAAAYGSAVLFLELRRAKQFLFGLAWVVMVFAALLYPVITLSGRIEGITNSAKGQGLRGWDAIRYTLGNEITLDGMGVLRYYIGEDEVDALRWMQSAPYGVVAEAVGGSYNIDYFSARSSTYSGLPNVVGWPGHESQWGRSYDLITPRQNDMETLYRTNSWDEAKSILDKYQIRYVYVGGSERTAYHVNEQKFDDYLVPVFQSGTVTIYEVPGRDGTLVAEQRPWE